MSFGKFLRKYWFFNLLGVIASVCAILGFLHVDPFGSIRKSINVHQTQTQYTFPENEAGICAYVNIGQNIDLENARTLLRGGAIYKDENYITGTFELDGATEQLFPYVYISQSGWILAYYSELSPFSSIVMKWDDYEGESTVATTLSDAISKICLDLRASEVKDNIKYYHYKYPGANKMLLIADWASEGRDSFTYKIPFNITMFECSWSHYTRGGPSPMIGVDRNVYLNGDYLTGIKKVASYLRSYKVGYLRTEKLKDDYIKPNRIFDVKLQNMPGQGFAVAFIYSDKDIKEKSVRIIADQVDSYCLVELIPPTQN